MWSYQFKKYVNATACAPVRFAAIAWAAMGPALSAAGDATRGLAMQTANLDPRQETMGIR
jgi:hypothetical protein